MHTNLIVDLNNLVFSTRFAKIKTPSSQKKKESYVAELIFKDALSLIVSLANEFKANGILIASDSSNVWRKDIYPDYKGNRDHADVYYDETIEAANMMKEFFRTCTNSTVSEVPRAEADDIIAVACQDSVGVENLIISSDKDFMQLLNDHTRLYSPAQGVWRVSDDVGYDLFLKCIRGDLNDNIRSAYPRVWEKKLRAAWENDYDMLNLMETVRKDGLKVGDEFEKNRNLIDLSLQPDYIRQAIRTSISSPAPANFGELKMAKWLASHNLKEFAYMLEYKERPLCGRFVLKNENK